MIGYQWRLGIDCRKTAAFSKPPAKSDGETHLSPGNPFLPEVKGVCQKEARV
jgi:hypothetical protein